MGVGRFLVPEDDNRKIRSSSRRRWRKFISIASIWDEKTTSGLVRLRSASQLKAKILLTLFLIMSRSTWAIYSCGKSRSSISHTSNVSQRRYLQSISMMAFVGNSARKRPRLPCPRLEQLGGRRTTTPTTRSSHHRSQYSLLTTRTATTNSWSRLPLTTATTDSIMSATATNRVQPSWTALGSRTRRFRCDGPLSSWLNRWRLMARKKSTEDGEEHHSLPRTAPEPGASSFNSWDGVEPDHGAASVATAAPESGDHIQPIEADGEQQQHQQQQQQGEEDFTPDQFTDRAWQRGLPDRVMGRHVVAATCIQGFRPHMEDEFLVERDAVAVFDGHGGSVVSTYLSKRLYHYLQAIVPTLVKAHHWSTTEPTASSSSHQAVERAPATANEKMSSHWSPLDQAQQQQGSNGWVVNGQLPPGQDAASAGSLSAPLPTVDDFKLGLRLGLQKVDREILSQAEKLPYQGSTVVFVWFHESTVTASSSLPPSSQAIRTKRSLVTANIGDSRAVLCRKGAPLALTRDHKPNDPRERDRIVALGGHVIWTGYSDGFGEPIEGTGDYRVNGALALSRAVGDAALRPVVVSDPEISIVTISDQDEFVVVATDGLWEVMTSAEVVHLVQQLSQGVSDVIEREDISHHVVAEAIRRGSMDNITVIIVWLDDVPPRPPND